MLRITLALVCFEAASLFAQDRPDISTIAADLTLPPVHQGPLEAGRRCYETTPGWEKTKVRHLTYLPTDWKVGKTLPVIVEYAGNGNYRNNFGDVSTGWVDGSKLGYGISGGEGFLWVCLPFLNEAGTDNVNTWWGDPPTYRSQATIDYCLKTVPYVCQKYGGDPKRVLLVGFSRGAIACNAIGLANDAIAGLWCGMVPFSHYHGVYERWPFTGAKRDTARENLERLKGRPQFICGESDKVLADTKAFLEGTKIAGKFTIQHTGFRNHNDAWILRPSPVRDQLRAWVKDVSSK